MVYTGFLNNQFYRLFVTSDPIIRLIGKTDSEPYILLILGGLSDIQRALARLLTPLYAIRTLHADNASMNTGVAGGLAALLGEARKAAHPRDNAATPYLPLKFKGCDDHILALALTWFNTLFCEWAENAGLLDLMHNRKDKIGVKEKVSNIATPLHALKRMQKRVHTWNRSAWRAARHAHDALHPPPRGKRKPVVRCSLGHFCTFGVTARGVLQYREVIRDSSLKFDVDTELIGWLDNPLFVFVWPLLEGYTTSFELPFLSQSHKLGVSRAIEYENSIISWVDFVKDWWYNPEGAFFHLPPLETLPGDQRRVVLLMIAAVHDTFQTHVVPHVNNGDGFTSTTNRFGEIVFR